jgi:hypothetical protein
MMTRAEIRAAAALATIAPPGVAVEDEWWTEAEYQRHRAAHQFRAQLRAPVTTLRGNVAALIGPDEQARTKAESFRAALTQFRRMPRLLGTSVVSAAPDPWKAAIEALQRSRERREGR